MLIQKRNHHHHHHHHHKGQVSVIDHSYHQTFQHVFNSILCRHVGLPEKNCPFLDAQSAVARSTWMEPGSAWRGSLRPWHLQIRTSGEAQHGRGNPGRVWRVELEKWENHGKIMGKPWENLEDHGMIWEKCSK